MTPTELKRKGNLLYKERKYVSAEECFRELIRIEPTSKDGYIGLAKVFTVTKTPTDIVSVLEPVADKIESFQLLSHLVYAYASLLVDEGRKEYLTPAILTAQRVLDICFDTVTAHYLAIIFLKECKDPESALSLFEACWQKEPRSRPAFEGVLECYRQLGRADAVESAKSRWKHTTGAG